MKMHVMLILIASLLVLSGCVKIHGLQGPMDVERTEAGLSAVEKVVLTTEKLLVAKVKGSIYESGETVSVFGTCLDADDGVIPGVDATMSAWYPNGTQFIFETPMTEVTPGHFLYTAPMNPVRGTYLTRLKCALNESFAFAFGEWQNPYWVQRINDTQALVNVTLQEVLENQELINNLSDDVEAGFNETFNQINNTNTLINDSTTVIINNITQAAAIANASVDRNDSYIVNLLLQIINNGTPTTGPGGALSFIEEFQSPVFHRSWTINVTAFIGSTQVGSEAVSCFINTTNANPTVGAQLEPIAGPKFQHTEVVKKLDDFDWDVWCVEV